MSPVHTNRIGFCMGAVACLGFSIVFSNLPANAASVKVSTKIKYYEISGNTSQQLRRQMRLKGPGRFAALTKTNVHWDQSCKVTLKITYTYPRWKDQSKASAKLRKDWKNMMRVMIKHEETHGRHSISAANEVAAAKCKNANGIFRKWERISRLFDRRTNHGIKQGMVLP